MTKFLKPKNMRRLALLSVLAAPIIYLFGGLFTGLIGAHGEIVFADDESSYVAVTDTANIPSNDYMFIWDRNITGFDIPRAVTVKGLFESGGVAYRQMYIAPTYIYYYPASSPTSNAEQAWSTNGWENGRDVIEFNSNDFPSFMSWLSYGQLMAKVPTAKNNADFVFGQMFPEDNFVSKIGEDVFTGDISSQPISQLIQYVDENMFDVEQYSWGKFLYGYVYYAVTSVLIYEVVAISLFVLLLPIKALDIFEERLHL